MANQCLNCHSDLGDGVPRSHHCDQCPPWECETCGQMCSVVSPCSCWVSVERMPLADLKAIFARGHLSIDIPRSSP